jgi:hypothetical protein
MGIVGSNEISPLDLPKDTPANIVPTGEAEYARGSSSCAFVVMLVKNAMLIAVTMRGRVHISEQVLTSLALKLGR